MFSPLRAPNCLFCTFGSGLLFGLQFFLFFFCCSLAECFSFIIYLFIYFKAVQRVVVKRIKFRQLAACNSVSDRFLCFKIRLHDLHTRRKEINKFKASVVVPWITGCRRFSSEHISRRKPLKLIEESGSWQSYHKQQNFDLEEVPPDIFLRFKTFNVLIHR